MNDRTPATRTRSFGRTPAGDAVDLFTLSNDHGLEIEITNYGGIVVALRVPDRNGRIEDIVLGFDTLEAYLGPHPYFGGIIGRFGNRIAGGRFSVDGRDHLLTRNDGVNHLHGGYSGFDRKVWLGEARATPSGPSLLLRMTSDDGDEGYPGKLDCEVAYTLTNDNELRIDYAAATDRPTIVNLTHHSYFNLAGPLAPDVLGHELQVDADTFTPVGEGLIPTGEFRAVAGTPFDFREPTLIGARVTNNDPQLVMGRGYDHNFVLNRAPPHASTTTTALSRVARVCEPRSGRVMDVLTTEPGLQVYSGGALDGAIAGKGGRSHARHAGLCLETQHFPDSPNQPGFPSTRLDPGQAFWSTTIYRFSTAPGTSR